MEFVAPSPNGQSVVVYATAHHDLVDVSIHAFLYARGCSLPLLPEKLHRPAALQVQQDRLRHMVAPDFGIQLHVQA
jgi:hypothetical protein